MSFIRAMWKALAAPSRNMAVGVILLAGLAVGVVGVLGFDFALHETSTNAFCVSCHELRDNALKEFVGTPHHTNASGKVATCSDCHVPREFVPKMVRKVRAISEIYHHLLGTIDTPEKYDEHRMWMASKTWAFMKERDSRECRNCHDVESWDLSLQSEKARKYHSAALSRGKTCIDCHKGVAHELPPGIEEDRPVEGIDS